MKVPACAAAPFAAIAALLAAAPAQAQAQAQEGDAPPPVDTAALEGDGLTIGLAAGVVPSYEGSDDTAFSIIPGLRGRVSGINFMLRGNRFWADLVPTSSGPGWDIQLGPVIQANFNRHSSIVDAQVKKLPKRDIALETGAFAGIARQGVVTSDYDKLGVSLAYVHDVLGAHGSYVITPAIDYSTPLSTTAYIGINLSADYVGRGYADYYFSVDAPGSAASGLPVFSAGKGWKDWTIASYAAVSLTGDLTRGLALVGAGSYRRMLDDSAASPVTSVAGSPNQWTGMLGLAYTF
ncbi:MipA/OmpV family protein [Sphingomonas canadensis]|uniref:MipA/OmpV family protein n=1 Tax=Sphingomonas canadensis TaxID=1219257 RepID=A0ABW3H3L3_9SPHN|nr:MipA/OmpV family protein [Sphingomonas canadensis]MCW3834623.1 MipA/OmpV family protein [Sphingomonas canadensis]